MSEPAYTPKRQRSPSYPAIDLEAAIERARTLYEKEGRNVAPNNAILDHWGYSPRSGPGFGVLGALKRFGLLKNEGPGKSRLSDLGLRIILDEREDSTERAAAIKQAALAPGIHREIMEKYPGGLPSDATLRHFLRLERGFTDSAADDLISELRATIAFAELSRSDSLSLSDGDNQAGEQETVSGASTVVRKSGGGASQLVAGGSGAAGTSVPIPLSANEWVSLQGAFPLSEQAWDQLLRVLEVMKPGLVAPAVDNDGADEESP